MPKIDRPRIDYQPGQAAIDAIHITANLLPKLRTQALIDKLVITGLCALHWQSPQLWGSDRDRWSLPIHLQPRQDDDANK